MLHRIPQIRKLRRFVVVLTRVAAAGMVPAFALAANQELDRGTLLITRGVDTLGIEQFAVTGTPAGIEINVTASYPRRRPRVIIEGTLRLTAEHEPEFAAIETTRGRSRRVLAQFSLDRAVFRRFSDRGESAHEFPPPDRPVLAFDSVFGFFAALPQAEQVTLVNPQYDRFVAVRLTDRGVETTSLGGVRTRLRHVTLAVADGTIHVWYRGDRLQKVEVPSLNLVAERIPTPRR